MLLFLSLAHATLPAATASWSSLAASPVKIECTEVGGKPYCRSTGVIGAPVDSAKTTFEALDQHVSQMGSISAITRLEPDVLRIVMDYPFPFEDRDYVARFTHREEAGAHVFGWVPVEHASAPVEEGIVRLGWLDGEWRFTPEGANTRVTYTWQADPGGNLPDVGAVRKKAGFLAVQDMAAACGTKVLSP